MIRVLLADNHPLLHPGIRAILSTTDELTLIDAVTCCEQLQQYCHTHQPNVVLLASNIISPSDLDILDHLQQHCPTAKTLVLLTKHDKICPRQLIDHGAVGGILKNDTPDKLIEAIRTVVKGEIWFSSSLLQKLVQSKSEKQVPNLTERELEMLQLVVAEKTSKEIALAFGIAERTVRCHLNGIYTKLGVNTRVGAAVEAITLKLVQK